MSSASTMNVTAASSDELPCAPVESNLSDEPQTCPSAADALLKPPVKQEGLIDRADAFALGLAIAVAVCYSVSQFDTARSFSHENAPLLWTHTYSLPAMSVSLYLIVVLVIAPALRANKNAAPLLPESTVRFLLRYWNLALSLLSLCMLIGMAAPLTRFAFQYGLTEAICDRGRLRWAGSEFFWMYVFTMSKFIELFDTAFMVVRRKPVSFLHWYHHTSVLVYTWFAVAVGFCPGWYFATVNSAVHTIMYWYYYRSACGVRLTYDKFITTIQLTQMVFGVVVTGIWAWMHYATDDGVESCPCEHADAAMYSAWFMYGSYFALFLSFYCRRYVARTASKDE